MKTQCDAIFEYLSAVEGRWVEMPELVRISGSYVVHSRIAELRKRGHTIICDVQQDERGKKHSRYALVPASDSAIDTTQPATV